MRFCQAFMLGLWKNLGPDRDVPAGDIGVGAREVGYMYGMYKRLVEEHNGTFTGKGLDFGGSLIRPEATGFGALYFVQSMLAEKNDTIAGKTVAVSGFGNVAWGATLKATELGAKLLPSQVLTDMYMTPTASEAIKLIICLNCVLQVKILLLLMWKNIPVRHSTPGVNHGNRK